MSNLNVYIMANSWVEHIKKWAKDNNSTYGCALSNPRCKEEYAKGKAKNILKNLGF